VTSPDRERANEYHLPGVSRKILFAEDSLTLVFHMLYSLIRKVFFMH
jgi:hypothetical protein